MKRRRFMFWIGMGLFGLAEKLCADGLDELAAKLMRGTESKTKITPPTKPEHWTAQSNNSWQWFERENLVDGKWKVTGITTPTNKWTGEPFVGKTGYLDDSLVPDKVRFADQLSEAELNSEGEADQAPGHADAIRRARHGRPPSKWLRSLNADELRIWLKTIDPPEADVSGMTFWTHLTRDHSFDPKRIVGLNNSEQAKLHAAAHAGY